MLIAEIVVIVKVVVIEVIANFVVRVYFRIIFY